MTKQYITQENLVYRELNKHQVCNIKDKYPNQLTDISVDTVENIMSNKFANGSDMKAVLCMFETLLLSSDPKGRQGGLLPLSASIHNWITNIKKLNFDSMEGAVYITDVLSEKIQVIIKVPLEKDSFKDMVREYYIGVTALNKLRYYLPTVVYTLGAFLCVVPKGKKKKICTGKDKVKDRTAFVIYEKIPGPYVGKLLKDGITQEQFIGIFVQLLITLEVAQRECRFTHFDLHNENVMVRSTPGFSYNVPIGSSCYEVHTPDYMPVIIDFGFSSAHIDGRTIGRPFFTSFGMMNYMIQGFDMYKFLMHCGAQTELGNTKYDITDFIRSLFAFYGNDDPYKFNRSNNSFVTAFQEYGKEVTYTKASTYTPQMFLDWILEHPEYGPFARTYVTKKKRDVFFPIKFSNSIQEYNNIFTKPEKGVDKAVEITSNCITLNPSYILSSYNIYILENLELRNQELENDIVKFKLAISIKRDEMIANDNQTLNRYRSIQVPSSDIIRTATNNILNKILKDMETWDETEDSVLSPSQIEDANRHFEQIQFVVELRPYLKMLYTIRELKLESSYIEWITEFENSIVYNLYIENEVELRRAFRWMETISDTQTLIFFHN